MNDGPSIALAEGLFEYGEQASKREEMRAEFVKLREIARKTPSFSLYFDDPSIPYEDKKKLLERILPSFDKAFATWCLIALRKRKLGSIEEIADRYDELYEKASGRKRGIVYSAHRLGEGEIRELERRLGKEEKGEVSLDARVDPSLIGGYRIYVGGKLIDMSVRGRLERIEKSLLAKEGGA